MSEIHALAATKAKGKLEPFSYDPGPLGNEEVEIEVQYCGICHSDYSMLANEWGMTKFPFVPGHEAAGKVVAAGKDAKRVKVGDAVGLGWNSSSCLHCHPCLRGDHNMCEHLGQTIVGRHGAFATRVRCHWVWATPIPQGLSLEKIGPLLCGGITVFNPLIQLDVKPTDRVGVVGIGGLGHMALMFLNKWGCHVTAFTSSPDKADDLKKMGAHDVLNTRSEGELKKAAGAFDVILSTVMAKLPWPSYLNMLASRGRLHTVGVPLEPIGVPAFSLIAGQKSLSGSPSGAPSTVDKMLEFCVRHNIAPITEDFPMSQANEAFEHLEAGKARYRIVLKNDLQ